MLVTLAFCIRSYSGTHFALRLQGLVDGVDAVHINRLVDRFLSANQGQGRSSLHFCNNVPFEDME